MTNLVGAASDVTQAMELGADAVLLNTGIAHAKDAVRMAHAMRHALEAGRQRDTAADGCFCLGRQMSPFARLTVKLVVVRSRAVTRFAPDAFISEKRGPRIMRRRSRGR